MCYTPGVGEGWCKVILDYISELEDRVVKCQILQNVFAESEVITQRCVVSSYHLIDTLQNRGSGRQRLQDKRS